jgi:Fe-Mn family superoxide dismutase
MNIILPSLPYKIDALEPFISSETLEFHHGVHHKKYVDNLNILIKNTEFYNKNLVEIIKSSTGNIFNNAAQAWNHDFYWKCLTPAKNKNINKNLLDIINKNFNNFDTFKKKFIDTCLCVFGSGWVWLVKDINNKLHIVTTFNAGTPITKNKKSILVCDVWEHAYYIDYRSSRLRYIESFWQIINWDFVYENIFCE